MVSCFFADTCRHGTLTVQRHEASATPSTLSPAGRGNRMSGRFQVLPLVRILELGVESVGREKVNNCGCESYLN
jgi:hypothetical protein